MKLLFAVVFSLVSFFAAAEPPVLPFSFAKATEFYIATGQVRIYSDNAVYAQTHLPTPCEGNCVEGAWYRVNLSAYGVPTDAKAAFLAGMLIITHGTTAETADIHVTFRRPGDTNVSCAKYMGQSVETAVGGGQRSNLAVWVPLEDASFDWCYTTSTGGNWPTNSAYGVNLSLQAYVR